MASEEVMRQWDAIRATIAAGNKSSGPRDWFENVIDDRDARIAELEAALREVRASVIANANDVLWHSEIETVVDRIDSALND